MEFKQVEERPLDYITEAAQKNHVLNKYLKDKQLVLKEYPFEKTITVLKVKDDGSQIAVKITDFNEFSSGQSAIFYTILNKYIEIECKIAKIQEDNTMILVVNKLGIAKKNRDNNRIPGNGNVHASKLVTAKTIIDANMFQIPTLVKVAFDDFKAKLNEEVYETVKIDIFKPDLPRRFAAVKKTMKPLFIEDTSDKSKYSNDNENRLSYGKDIDEEIETEIKNFASEMIISEMIVPVIYGETAKFPIGYILIQNREKPLTEKNLLEVQSLAEKMVQRILESNTMQVNGKFPIIDASPTGVQLQVNNFDLMKILPKQKHFIFDITFKMQPPLTVLGNIRWTAKKNDEELLLGVELEGKSDLPGERMRYIRNLEEMQKE
ncbi:DUF1577 domain-containing protein [Leptospira sp. GIMC2001]|uniref:DUF1577 domain-containing protein n=1 Tax=Leptospira sp. GIMC2001 TaxID=1513297 RepID=UPI002349EEB6|nr:DUF1577 domain-containing protein [Leptospira sp. GIMC2001]WCL49232.1 DUF1577 domain-containing protein [Leptospira sp. GIMC2001]